MNLKKLSRQLFRQGIVYAVLALMVLVPVLWDDIRLALDDHAIEGDQTARQRRHQLGQPLPGTPDLTKLNERLAEAGLALGAPVLIRIFKAESQLELWMKRGDRFALFATYPVCRWSGKLGPKLKEGDKQAPEGFYTVGRQQLNPESRWHRSFNIGYPNVFDRAHSRTGSYVMVHGGCSSVGCYAMTNATVDEIWRLVTAALDKGQPLFQVQALPFRMSDANLRRRSRHAAMPFWQELKRGHDLFEANHLPPKVTVCDGRYAFSSSVPGEPADLIAPGCPPARVASN